MTLPPHTSGRPSHSNRFFLKIVLFALIPLLGARAIYDLSRHQSTVDVSKIDALVAEAQQQNLTERGLELIKGPVHEPSDPTRKCQGNSLPPLGFHGTATLNLQDDTEVKLTISDCHPCIWPTKAGEDISAYAQLDVESSDNQCFSIVSYVGGHEEHSTGSFRLELPVDIVKRSRILYIIQQIAEHGASPKRAEFNLVLNEVLSSLHLSISDEHSLRLGALLCKSVALSVKPDKTP